MNPFHVSGSEDASGCLRINVVVGSDFEATLPVGERPFLDAIGLIQKAKQLGTKVDDGQVKFLCSTFDKYSESAQYDKINRWDPKLFLDATGTRDDQKNFYSKVWRLHMHFECYIFVVAIGQRASLRLIEPDFAKLEVQITLTYEAGRRRLTLYRGDVEGDSYHLFRTALPWRFPSTCEDSWRDMEKMQDGYFATGVD